MIKNTKYILLFMCGITLMLIVFPSAVIWLGNIRTAKSSSKLEVKNDITTSELLNKDELVAVFRSNSETLEYVPLEEYVVGVVAAEVPSSFKEEALKAQSVTARTYVVRKKYSNKEDSEQTGDITDQVTDQVYYSNGELKKMWGNDYETRINKIRNAVQATEGQVLSFNGELIMATFFSTSNGKTENSEDYWQNELPYLRSVDSPWDSQVPSFSATNTMAISEFEEKMGVSLGDSTEVGSNIIKTDGGRVRSVSIGGKTFSGKEVREKLSLRSSDFTFERKESDINIITKGYGHGVGMSQNGANEMAKDGKTYIDILSHYYTSTEIASVTAYIPQWVATK